MDKQEMNDDLAYIRSMAEEGRNVPLVGGLMFVIWGSVIGTAALVQFLDDINIINLDGNLWLWLGAITAGWVISIIVGRTIPHKPGAFTFANRTNGAAWFGCGLFITIYFLSLIAAQLIMPDSAFPYRYLFGTMFPLSFGLYGLAFYVTSVAANLPWIKNIAFVSWLFSVLAIFSLGSSVHMLLAAMGTIAVVIVPGIIMIRNQPSTTV